MKQFPTAVVTAVGIVILLIGAVRIAGAVHADAYPDAQTTGVWASLADYRARILTVPGVTASVCTQGVVYLGESRYRVPESVSWFRCEGGSQ